MKPLSNKILSKLAASTGGKKGRRLITQRRLWKLIDRLDEPAALDTPPLPGTPSPPVTPSAIPAVPPGSAAAFVLDEAPEPYLVRWNGSEAECECSASQPCTHLAALLFQLAENHPTHPGLLAFTVAPGTKSSPAATRGSTNKRIARRPPPETVLDPEQDLLFFRVPDPVDYRAVFVLGEKKSVGRLLKSPILPAALKISEAGFKGCFLTDLSGSEWALLPALIIISDDGTTSAPKPWRSGAAAMPSIPEPLLNPGKTSERASALESLMEDGFEILSPGGERWVYQQSERVALSFQPLLSAENSEGLFEPLIAMESGSESVEGALFPSSDGLLLLDPLTAKARSLKDSKKSTWFIRLLLSRRVLSLSDIRARFNGNRQIPQSMRIQLPQTAESLEILKPSLVLEAKERNGATELSPHWRYKTVILRAADKTDIIVDTGYRHAEVLGLRDKSAEEVIFSRCEALLTASLSWKRGRYASLAGDSNIPLHLEMKLSQLLSQYGSALISEGIEIRLENRPIKKGGTLNLSARKDGDMLEMNAGIGEADSLTVSPLELDDWLDQGKLARTSEAYFTLTDKALEQLRFLQSHGMDENGFLSTSPDNLSLIDAVYAELEVDDQTNLDIDKKRELYAGLSNFSPEFAPAVPKSFRGVLRPYQFHGYAWLLHLHQNKLGACLADDMGLGKTVQTLAYISRLKADSVFGASLLVGPVVTLGNWEAEVSRFTPELKIYRYSGAADKRNLPTEDENVDLVIVSYQTLRNDAERFLSRRWNHVILDEAHYIKNASSRTFKTVRSLKSDHQISLTGTPLENHLGELWSQMSFLNPGLLGSHHEFRNRFVKTGAISLLSDLVAPFLLRRKKADVLHDLPPKDETVIRCDMSDAQTAAYHSVRDTYFRQVSGLLSSEGLDQSRMEIFTLLSKLRLLAIHPPLAGEQFAGVDSGKMAVLDNLLDGILEEDHKVLVFSQFLGALDRVQANCDVRSWRYSRLTGATRNREDEINRFSDDKDIRIFLLSLRAGGIGINLTAADYVILLDPWWNPAVEAQAIDRAHRMGQKRPVMAYRLITSGTIEEKVLELQESKRELVAAVLGEGEMPKLSEEEILNLFR